MGGVVSALGTISLHLLSSLAPNLLLLPRHRHHNRRRQIQMQQRNDNKLMDGIVSALGSILSSLAPNLSLFPHHNHRRIQMQQQHNRLRRRQIQILVVDQQTRQHTQISLIAIAEGEDTLYTINYGPRGMTPLACCHGVFLSVMHYTQQLAIWNSKSKVIKTIPQSTVPRPPCVVDEFVKIYGFGFDPSSNDYKVIRVLKLEFEDYSNNLLVELYSLKTNSWKQIAYPHGYGLDASCVYTNDGFCYCISTTVGDHVFIPFDLANDNFLSALIPGPKTLRSSFAPLVFEGSLAVIAYQCMPFEFELWVWNNNNESWSLRGAWANIVDPDTGYSTSYSPRGEFLNNGFLFLQNPKDGLVLFDCEKQTLKKILGVCDLFVDVFPFVESHL